MTVSTPKAPAAGNSSANVHHHPDGASEDGLRNLNLGGHVGFDSLPDQLVNKAVQSGFTFNLMCIGETGLGKSTLMDSLFNTAFEVNEGSASNSPARASHDEPGVRLKAHTYQLEESNVKLKVSKREKTRNNRERAFIFKKMTNTMTYCT